MHPDLERVIALQQLDTRLAELTAQIDALPEQVRTIQKQLDEFIRAHEERKQRLAANQKERRELEGEVQEIRQKISKHKDQLYEVKTNEQYRAMLKEIEGEEEKIRKIEDHILEKMIEAEEIQGRVAEAAAVLEGEKARVAAETRRLEGERQKDLEERARHEAERQTLASALSAEVLELYERVRKARHGVAVARVRDGLCTACNFLLRPQLYNEVRTNDALHTCESCTRILYYLEPQPEGAAPEGAAPAEPRPATAEN